MGRVVRIGMRDPMEALSETPRYVGRGIAALAADPDRARWNKRSQSSAQLGREYGVRDVDGSSPDIWSQIERLDPGS